jgi:hypothetical protein
MSADTDRLLNNARVHLPGVTDATIQLELFNVLNDFFQVTNAWQEDIDFQTSPSVVEYTITPTGTSTINRLIWVQNANQIPVDALMPTPGTIKLILPPSQIDTLTATVALTIDDPVDGDGFPNFPAWVLTKYNTGILDGVLGRLMAQPAKPYTNAQLAVIRLKSYIAARSSAKAEVLHGNQNNGQTWRFPQQFRTRGQRF